MTRETSTAVNRLANNPNASVTANPRTGPEPNRNRIIAETIVVTCVSMIVSAMILFLFGSGPVRGFAVTLAFGLFANLFTAVLVSRVIFDAILQKKQRGAALSI